MTVMFTKLSIDFEGICHSVVFAIHNVTHPLGYFFDVKSIQLFLRRNVFYGRPSSCLSRAKCQLNELSRLGM
uniref:Uncharacterized protein n=1 Tax=Anguilla anguilla TaxID=7936 RepID=A0A0E9WWE5_ANGAN